MCWICTLIQPSFIKNRVVHIKVGNPVPQPVYVGTDMKRVWGIPLNEK